MAELAAVAPLLALQVASWTIHPQKTPQQHLLLSDRHDPATAQ
jgi:hypothetical protein